MAVLAASTLVVATAVASAAAGGLFSPAQGSENRGHGGPKNVIFLLGDGMGTHRKGFFLQVEGASIDKQDHATNACGQLGETVAFDNAIGVALDYQRSHPDTLVVVTADHGHTSRIVSEDASGSGLPTGYSTNLVSKDGQTLTLTYGTAGFGGDGNKPVGTPPSQQHTGTVVPVWGQGPGADAILGTNDHTDLYKVLSRWLPKPGAFAP